VELAYHIVWTGAVVWIMYITQEREHVVLQQLSIVTFVLLLLLNTAGKQHWLATLF